MATNGVNTTVTDIEKGHNYPHHRGPHDNTIIDDPTSYLPRAPGHRLGNPGPLGLTSFASTTFILSLINLRTRGVLEPNVVVGMAIFCGGLAQLLAGMWEFACGNTFGATAFTGYGSFWMSYATILIPSSGILSAYAGDADMLHDALGIYLFSWFIFTVLLTIAATRRNVAFIALLTCLSITFLLLGAAEFTGSVTTTKAGGGMGVITAFIAYYCALAELLRPDDSWFTLPLGQIKKAV